MKPWLFMALTSLGLVGVGAFIWSVSGVRDSGAGSGQVEWVRVGKTEVGQLVPEFKARDNRKNVFQFSELKKLSVINFWAPWCGPCLEEIPSMAALARKMDGQLEIIAISSDPDFKEYQRALDVFPDLRNSPIRLVFDPDKKVMRAYGVTGFPESFVVSADGKLVKKIVGPLDWLKLPEDFWVAKEP